WASISSVQTNVIIASATALVASVAGADAVAGYGTGGRLEYLLIPLVFGLGAPLVALVGTNIGAGKRHRALHIALVGGRPGFSGWGVPAYGFFGLGLSLYFASQGAGRLFWPLFAGLLRMLIAIGGGW